MRDERRLIWIAVALMALAIVVLMSAGCGSTKTVYQRVEVPVPYWSPPEGVEPLPPEPNYAIPHLTEAEAVADPTGALTTVGQDLALCLGDAEALRHLYGELLKLIAAAPETPPQEPPEQP